MMDSPDYPRHLVAGVTMRMSAWAMILKVLQDEAHAREEEGDSFTAEDLWAVVHCIKMQLPEVDYGRMDVYDEDLDDEEEDD
jgi:hypothetical protein